MRFLNWLSAAAVLAACGCGSSDSDGDLGRADEFSDQAEHIAERGEVKGSLEVGDRKVSYTGDPEFWLFELEASRGDLLNVTASSGNGDPVVWLFDPDFELLAKNDDAFGGATESEIFHAVDAAGTYTVAIADVLRRPAKFTLSLAGATTADPADLASFLALPAPEKLDRLYREFEEFSFSNFEASLSAEFTRTSLRIVDETSGPAKTALLAAFFALRDDCLEQGGTAPEVSALRKGGLIYGVEMECVEDNEDREWQFLQALDGNGELLGTLGNIGF